MKALGLGIALLVGLASGAATAADCTLRLGWFDYPPFLVAQKDASPSGLDIEMGRAVAERAGCEIKYVERSWPAILKALEQGELDMAVAASRSTEREAFANFSTPYRRERVGLMVKAGEAAKHPLEDIGDITKSELRIGAIQGRYYGNRFNELSKDPEFAKLLDIVTDDTYNLNKVAAGRLFGFLADPVAVPLLLKAKGVEGQLEFHPLLVVDDPVHLIFSKKSVPAETLAKMDAAIREVEADGTLGTLMAKYTNVH